MSVDSWASRWELGDRDVEAGGASASPGRGLGRVLYGQILPEAPVEKDEVLLRKLPDLYLLQMCRERAQGPSNKRPSTGISQQDRPNDKKEECANKENRGVPARNRGVRGRRAGDRGVIKAGAGEHLE